MKFIDFTQIFDEKCDPNTAKMILCYSEEECQEFWAALNQQMPTSSWSSGKSVTDEGTHYKESEHNDLHAIAYKLSSNGLRVTYSAIKDYWHQTINFKDLPVYEFDPDALKTIFGPTTVISIKNYRDAKLFAMMCTAAGLSWRDEHINWGNTKWNSYDEKSCYYFLNDGTIKITSSNYLNKDLKIVPPDTFLQQYNETIIHINYKLLTDSNTVVKLNDLTLATTFIQALRQNPMVRIDRVPDDLSSGAYGIREGQYESGKYYATYGLITNYVHKGKHIVDLKDIITITEPKKFPMDGPKQNIKQLVTDFGMAAGKRYKANIALKQEQPLSCSITISNINETQTDMTLVVTEENEQYRLSDLSFFQIYREVS